jgi:translation elongation factor EF-Ts
LFPKVTVWWLFCFGTKGEIKMTGRVEIYTHSDRSTFNKGGAMIRVMSQTDFCARTEDFISFTKIAAKYAYASSAKTWADVIAEYPSIEDARLNLERELKEKIEVEDIVILTV